MTSSFLGSCRMTFFLFSVYLIALYWIIVLKFNLSAYHAGVERSFNWVPFPSLFNLPGQGDLNESLLNIFIFIPLGLYLGILRNAWTLGRKAAGFFLLSFFFELSQFAMKTGAFDATDLVNNTMGGLVGLGIFSGLEKALGSQLKVRKILNLICLIGTILILSFLLFLKLNNLWIFRMQLLER